MGRRASPYTVYADPRTGLAWLNVRIDGKRSRKPLAITYEDDGSPGHAGRLRQAAAKAYAALIEGRSLTRTGRIATSSTLAELIADWLVEDVETYAASVSTTKTHAGHFESFAGIGTDRQTPLERIMADAAATDFVLYRLKMVAKETVIKEVSTLFRFYAWAEKREHITSMPPRPRWPKKALGTRVGTQREEPVRVPHAQLVAIIRALPEWVSRGGRNKGKWTPRAVPCRDLAELAYETGLRPSTIARLSGPEHFRPGSDSLWITPEIDKGKNKSRRVPLTKRARAIMERHYKVGVIFGKHDLRVQWKRAAAKVLRPDQRPEDFSIYDYRHGAAHRMVKLSGLAATQGMLGQKRITTINEYVKPLPEDMAELVKRMNKGG